MRESEVPVMPKASYLELKNVLHTINKGGKNKQESAEEKRKELMTEFVKRTTARSAAVDQQTGSKPGRAKPVKKEKPAPIKAARPEAAKPNRAADQQELYRLKHQLAKARRGLVAQQEAIQDLKQKVLAEQTTATQWQEKYQTAVTDMQSAQTANIAAHRTIQSLHDKNELLAKRTGKLRQENKALRTRLVNANRRNKALQGQWIAMNQEQYIAAYRLWQQEQSPYAVLKRKTIPALTNQIAELKTEVQQQIQNTNELRQVFTNEARWRPIGKVAVELFAPLVSYDQLKKILTILNENRTKPIQYKRPATVTPAPRPANIPLTDVARIKVTTPAESQDADLVKDVLAHTETAESTAPTAPTTKKSLHLALDRYSQHSKVRPAKPKKETPLPEWLENPQLFQDVPIHILTWQDARGIRNQLKQLGAVTRVERPDAMSINQIRQIAYSEPDAIIIADRTKAHHATVQAMKDIQADRAADHAETVIADKGIGATSTLRTIYDILLGRWSRTRALEAELINREIPSE
jgi:hypothetical protein